MPGEKKICLIAHLDEDWKRKVKNVRQAAKRLWATPAYPHAVDHGPAHADRIVAILDGLTEVLMERPEHALAGGEIYILLAAAYLHGIGLQDERSEFDPAVRWARYPELGAEMIYRALKAPEEAASLNLADDPSLVEMVALVVAGHGQTDYPSPDYDDFGVGGVIVRPRLLTALLCLADGLDLDYHRVDLERLKLMAVSPEEALNWYLHHYVSGVQVNDEYVRISYRVPKGEAAYEELLPDLVERQVRANFEALRDTFRLYGVKVEIAPPTAVRPMRAVQPMPAGVWAAAERRLARLRGAEPEVASLSPLIETVRGLLTTRGYDCQPTSQLTNQLTLLRCRPRGGGLHPPLVVGCKAGPVEVADVQAVAAQFEAADQQGYVIAETRLLPTAQQEARSSGRVRVLTLAGFYRELLDFDAYVKTLVDDYEESELARYYVDLGCLRRSYDDQGQVVGQDRYKPMDEYVDAWLKEQGAERNHVSILGDYGTGKTSFCRQYAAKQGLRWLAAPDRERIPILINLRDYTKTLRVSSLVTEALVNQYGVQGATFEAFTRYNADGKLLIFFDGFDEMAQHTGMRTAVDNFWELAQVVVPGSKVVLTCRTPYFRTHHEAETLLRGQMGQKPGFSEKTRVLLPVDYIDLRDRPNFEIIHLEPFTDEDVQTVLRARFPDRWKPHWEQIQRIYNLPDLARRPVLLDMIVQTLPDIKEGETVNAARLYQKCTSLWLERELAKERTLLTSDDRRLFAEELAMEMLRTGELTIHYSRIPDRVKTHFRLEQAEEIDYFEADVRTCNFLSRDDAGHYAFVHKSFMEFFAASRLHRLMLDDRATADGPVPINEEVRFFLNNLFALQPRSEPGPPYKPPDGFVWVPPGEFVLGAEGELPLQITRLDEGFFAARTPVTNAQYARFVAETRHKPPSHWKGARPPTRLADHPVVYVTWHDAVAYCEWAGARLPTEQEWEKAVRGYDGREYPWGEWTEGRCNTNEASIGKPSPVGQFSPDGDSPYGLQDAAGNVWEWMATEVKIGDDALRVLRGGSFYSDRRLARCACRRWLSPFFVWFCGGFRVVVSPISLPPLPSDTLHSGTLDLGADCVLSEREGWGSPEGATPSGRA
ncbi:MAG: SUMF1/EgtB/PvdO family nonheme iron enzyme [Chloroflexota bacterium]|nr:SUMF1/EgtB/PvdO family nonheme iron enzyme [Chloroflexota bacterium]